jgi:hypothetical protein
MASITNLPGLQDLLDGSKSWAAASDPRTRLLMTNTTADTENNKATLSAYTTIDSFDGSGASNVALTSEAVNVDSGNNRIELDADDVAFGALGNGTRQIQGILIYFHVTNDSDSIPVFFIQFSSNINPGGATVTVVWNAEGIVQFA